MNNPQKSDKTFGGLFFKGVLYLNLFVGVLSFLLAPDRSFVPKFVYIPVTLFGILSDALPWYLTRVVKIKAEIYSDAFTGS